MKDLLIFTSQRYLHNIQKDNITNNNHCIIQKQDNYHTMCSLVYVKWTTIFSLATTDCISWHITSSHYNMFHSRIPIKHNFMTPHIGTHQIKFQFPVPSMLASHCWSLNKSFAIEIMVSSNPWEQKMFLMIKFFQGNVQVKSCYR